MYYINDGVYGSFNCVLYDHYVPEPSLFAKVAITIAFFVETNFFRDEFRMHPTTNIHHQFGVQPAMVSIVFKHPFNFQNSKLAIGSTGKTWVPTQSPLLFNSMVYRSANRFTLCPNNFGK